MSLNSSEKLKKMSLNSSEKLKKFKEINFEFYFKKLIFAWKF